MTSPASPSVSPLGPHRYRDAWLKLPKVMGIYFGLTIIGLGGYVGCQYAMVALFPRRPVESKHDDVAPATAVLPSNSSENVPAAPISNQTLVPLLETTPPAIADVAGGPGNLAEVIASARHRNETVGQIVRQNGTRITIQMLPTQAGGGTTQPQFNEYVTLGPLNTQHDQALTPDSDGSVKHVVYAGQSRNDEVLHRPTNTGSTIYVPSKQIDKLVGALKSLDESEYKITVQIANPAVKREFEEALAH